MWKEKHAGKNSVVKFLILIRKGLEKNAVILQLTDEYILKKLKNLWLKLMLKDLAKNDDLRKVSERLSWFEEILMGNRVLTEQNKNTDVDNRFTYGQVGTYESSSLGRIRNSKPLNKHHTSPTTVHKLCRFQQNKYSSSVTMSCLRPTYQDSKNNSALSQAVLPLCWILWDESADTSSYKARCAAKGRERPWGG